ncbi:LamG domain-containing protein [Streptomyces sp. SID3212]|uniref:LamG domain-containing protein n=1 Tax=Streptomyces sp. SID3212 TaxID=2690259 RepID=UPI00136BB77B|nr:LamG domain-containing protein [Streptomyces sp. SID3212]MYV52413.1 LamG domain-containing protein [Streptomyces sp. SID3212]
MATQAHRRRVTTVVLAVAAVWAGQGGAVAATAVENLPPRQPVVADLRTGFKPCGVGEARAYVGDPPVLRAVLYDPEEDNRPGEFSGVKGEFEIRWRDADGVEQRLTEVTSQVGSGGTVQWRLPSDIPANTVVSWRVRADDGRAVSPWSSDGSGAPCEFVRDDANPALPVVSSPEYPEDVFWSDGVGTYGSFTFDSPSDDVVAYRYYFGGGPVGTVETTTLGGPVTIRYVPQTSGTQVLQVEAFDRAGRSSSPVSYTFHVRAGRVPTGQWKLADAPGSGTAAAGTGPAARAGSGVTFGAAAPPGTGLTSAARLDGTGHGFLTPGSSVVDTAKTFAVGAWVRPGRTDRDMTVVSQDADADTAGTPAFSLASRTGATGPAWTFAFGGARVSGGTPEAGEWTYVLGQYDTETGTARLYVNGEETGTEQAATATPSTGALQIGRARGNTGYRDRWQGEVADVRTYDRLVVPGEVTELARRVPEPRGHWSLESESDGASPELYDGAPLRLSPGATLHRGPDPSCIPDLDPGCPVVRYPLVGDGDLELDGAGGHAATDEPVVDTGDSFTVGVVVRLPEVDGDGDREGEGQGDGERPMTVLSQGGPHGDAFKLRYVPSVYRWQLVVSASDAPGAEETVVSQVRSVDEVQRLAVVHDDATDRITLYVDGISAPDATATVRSLWTSTGGLQVGRARTADGWGEYLHGVVDEVHAFAGALRADDIPALGHGTEPCLC